PVPPSGEEPQEISEWESPEISEGGAGPTIESPFDGHGRGEFSGDERHRNAQQERDNQQKDQAHTGAAGAYHALESEGAAGGVGKHYEDEIEEAGLADGRCRGLVQGVH